MGDKKRIRRFFDKVSRNRDYIFESCPILMYEQDMRQRAIIELLEPRSDDRILEVGCGNARDIIAFVQREAKCVGIDSSYGMIVEGKKKINMFRLDKDVEFIVGDGTKLPFRNETFNKVSCSEVIEHIPNYQSCVEEMSRVMSEGGVMVITTPNYHSFYGLTRYFTNFVLRLLRMHRRHPYDEWKTQEEVTRSISCNKIKIEKKVGICFIPGQLTYRLPLFCKKIIVKVCSMFETHLRWTLNKYGYSIGLSGRKI